MIFLRYSSLADLRNSLGIVFRQKLGSQDAVVDRRGVGPRGAVGGRGPGSRGFTLTWGTGVLFDPLGLGVPGS